MSVLAPRVGYNVLRVRCEDRTVDPITDDDALPTGAKPRRVTIVDVARAAEVSVASASKVMRDAPRTSEAMRRRVLAKVQELGYRPHRLAQGLRGPLKTIGMLLPDVSNPYFGLLLQGASEVFADAGYEIFISPAGAQAATHLSVMESLIDHLMAGLLLVAPRGTPETLERIAAQVPVVVLGRHGPGRTYDTVAGDDAAGARLVVDHLVEQGHSRITYLANIVDEGPELLETARLDGYVGAMRRHGLEEHIDIVQGEWTDAGGRRLAAELLSRTERPTAVFAGADVAAIGLLGEFWEHGIAIPDDIAVVGYDNSQMSQLRPISLSSVDQSGLEAGRIAARLLLERIEGRTTTKDELLAPSLIVRRTSDRGADLSR